MFFGTTPKIVSNYLAKEIKEHNPGKVFVLFAGNFVVEQIASQFSNAVIESTDVSIYSRAIGFGLCDKDFKLNIKPKLEKDFYFLTTKKKPLEKAAIVIMFSEIAKAFLKKDKIAYYQSQYKDAVNNQEKYFNQVISKLLLFKNTSRINFHGIDACLLVPEIKKGDFVFYDPPVILGDYEKMLDIVDEWLLKEKEK